MQQSWHWLQAPFELRRKCRALSIRFDLQLFGRLLETSSELGIGDPIGIPRVGKRDHEEDGNAKCEPMIAMIAPRNPVGATEFHGLPVRLLPGLYAI